MNPFQFLKNYEGEIRVNGQKIKKEQIDNIDKFEDEIKLELIPKSMAEKTKYRIVVKGWMANNSGNLDFHQRWNNGIPMPLQEMYGSIRSETPGMYSMDLKDANGGNHWIGFVSKSAIISMEEL